MSTLRESGNSFQVGARIAGTRKRSGDGRHRRLLPKDTYLETEMMHRTNTRICAGQRFINCNGAKMSVI